MLLIIQCIISLFVYPQSVLASTGNTVWKQAVVSLTSLQNVSLSKQLIYTPSEIVCALVATHIPWACLICQSNNVCNISSYYSDPDQSGVQISDPVTCKSNIQCLPTPPTTTTTTTTTPATTTTYTTTSSTTTLAATTTTTLVSTATTPVTTTPRGQCPSNFYSSSTPPYSSAPTKACPSPYTFITGFGCYLQGSGNATWNNSRTACIANGGDLVIFENLTPSQMLFIGDCFYYYNTFHLGFFGNKTSYQWVTGNIIPLSSNLWYSGYPTGTINPACGRTYNIQTYKLQDFACTGLLSYLCEIKIY